MKRLARKRKYKPQKQEVIYLFIHLFFKNRNLKSNETIISIELWNATKDTLRIVFKMMLLVTKVDRSVEESK